MRVRKAILTAMLMAGAGAAHAQSEPRPMIVMQMDAYFNAPRSVETFRALAGLGDPHIEPDEHLEQYGPPKAGSLVADLDARPNGYSDCRSDYAEQVYSSRIATLGRNHPYVRRWREVQQAIFSQCQPYDRASPVKLPDPLALADPALARLQAQDRTYQSASLLFYQDELAAARAAFAAIAATASPHRAAARYMVAALDAGSQRKSYDSRPPSPRAAHRGLAEARAILADPTLRAVHPLAHALIGWLGATLDDPVTRAAQVKATFDALEQPAALLARDRVAADLYARAAADVGKLHGDFADPAWWLNGAVPREYLASRATAERAATDDLAAWLLVPASAYEGHAWVLAGRQSASWERIDSFVAHKVEEGRDGLAWRVLRHLTGAQYNSDWSEIDTLIADARRGSEPAIAALPILFYQHVREDLTAFRGSDPTDYFAQTLDRLATYPFRDSDHYLRTVEDSLRYLMSVGRIADARALRDRVMRTPVAMYRFDYTLLLLLAEDDAALARAMTGLGYVSGLMNLLPRATLARLAARDDVPAELRARFARVAWTRTYALGKPIPAGLDRLMRGLNPSVVEGWGSRSGAHRPDEPALLVDVLRTPALNIYVTSRSDNYRELAPRALDTEQHSDNNWWCAWQPERHAGAAETALAYAFFPTTDADSEIDPILRAGLEPLLHASALWRSQDRAEADALAGIVSAPKLLTERAVAWAGDPGTIGDRPEALALAVRSTRYGCQRQGGHGVYSRAAFLLLHHRFGDTDAAKRTPYWFDCSHFFYANECASRDAKEKEIEDNKVSNAM